MSILNQLSNQNKKRSDFAIPELREYPIGDEQTAKASLIRVKKFGTAEEKEKVKAAILNRYPAMGVR